MNKSHSFFAQEPSVEPIGVIEAPGHEGKVPWIGGADGGAPCCGFRSKECRKPLDFEFVFHEFILVFDCYSNGFEPFSPSKSWFYMIVLDVEWNKTWLFSGLFLGPKHFLGRRSMFVATQKP